MPSCPAVRPLPSLDVLPEWQRIQELLAGPVERVDIAEINLLVSAARDPRVDVAATLAQLDAMAAEVRAQQPPDCGHRCQVDALNRYLFEQRGFRSEFDPSGLYRDIDRDLIDRVLATRNGYCEGLTVLYLALGRRVGVPLAAVQARQHMYVRYVGAEVPPFDIDPTQEGRAPLPEAGSCRAAAGVYGQPIDTRTLAGQMLGVLGIANGYVSLPWLDAAVVLAPRDPELRNNRGAERGRFDAEGALEEYRAARTLDPCVPLYAMNEARVLFALGRRDEAERLVDETDRGIAAREIAEGRVFVLLVRSSFAFERGDDAGAERYLAEALTESDGAPVALETLASTRRLQGRFDDAVHAMRAALVRDPSLRSRAGLLLAQLDAGQLFEASAQLDRALRELSTPGALDLHVALVGAALGRTDEAEAAARRCITRHGRRCARALVALGDVARWRGDDVCARRYYDAYLSCPRGGESRVQRAAEREVEQRLAAMEHRARGDNGTPAR